MAPAFDRLPVSSAPDSLPMILVFVAIAGTPIVIALLVTLGH